MLERLKRLIKPAKANPAPNLGSSEFEVNNWVVSRIVVKDLVPAVGMHPFPLNELMLMTGTVARLQPRYIFDWGTHIGKSARAFYEAAKALGVEVSINSIDLPDDVEHNEHPHTDRGKLVIGCENVKLHQGDGLGTSLEILAKLEPKFRKGQSVLFFVDGDHSYESVKRELSGIMKSAPQAAVLLHDTFYQSEDSGYNIGPHRAIGECLAAAAGKYQRLDTALGLPGMTLIYPLNGKK